MKAILNRVKPNMRRLLAFTLACLTAASALAVFTLPAAAAPATSEMKVWKWKRVNSKSDVKAILNGSYNNVTVPVYLCWETPTGASYVLQGANGGAPSGMDDDGFFNFFRDGIFSSPTVGNMPTDIVPYFKKYLQENYPGKVEEFGGIDIFFALAGNGYIKNFYNDVVQDNKSPWATSAAAKRFFEGGVLYNKTIGLMMASFGFPKGVATSSEKGLFYGSETFYTDTNGSDVKMTVRSDLSVYFQCGKSCLLCDALGLTDTNKFTTMNPGLTWWEVDPGNYLDRACFTLEPSDTKNDRAKYTDSGKLQLTHSTDKYAGGLCFDHDCINLLREKTSTYYSGFTLYYGVESKVSELDGDYTVKTGATQNFNNNMIIGSGARLVVEPGATVTVTGLLQNKGTIENCGTIVVNENSAIVTTGTGTIKNYGNTADFPSTYYRAKVAMATEEYERKFEQLTSDWSYKYYNPMRVLESDIEYYAQLARDYENIPQQKAIFDEIVQKYTEMREKLLAETADLRSEYNYFKNNRDKIIRDLIASKYNDEISRADATAEYEKTLAELQAEVDEKYTKPRAAIEKELEEFNSMITSDEWLTMSAEEKQAWYAKYNTKNKELKKLISDTQDLVDRYTEYSNNREEIIEQIYIAHGGATGTMTLAQARQKYEEQLAALAAEVDETYTKPRAALEKELEELKAVNVSDEWLKMSAEEKQAWYVKYNATNKELKQLIEDKKELLAKYEDYKNNRDKIIDDILEENGGKRADTGDTVTYSDCSGDLVVLEKGALFFDNIANEPLCLYTGATFMNAGVAVLPRGFLVSDAELQNASTGHIFAGFYVADTTFSGVTVQYPGTKNATLPNLKNSSGNNECLASGDYYLNNEGTIVCHGEHLFQDIDKKTSGLDKMFKRA